MSPYTIPPDELTSLYAFAITLGREAGTILLRGLERRRSGEDTSETVDKANAVDIVTVTDNEVEAFIHASIQKTYPSHFFVGEESYSAGSSKEYIVTDAPTWVVDPLDGTVNFTHAFPMFCVSIALVLNNKPIIGVIYAPLLNQLFSACEGRGAWLNETTRLPLLGKAIPPIPKEAPGKCIFGCEWGKDRRDIPEGNMHRKVNSFMNMAAEKGEETEKGGWFMGFAVWGAQRSILPMWRWGVWIYGGKGGCWEWDVAAGICLLQEAGGLITTANPPDDFENAPIEEANLGGRLYLAIRPAGDGKMRPEGKVKKEQCEQHGRESSGWIIRGLVCLRNDGCYD